MRLLLDTHIFLWVAGGIPSRKLSIRKVIESADEVFVSAATLWEIAIKTSIGKIKADPQALAAAIDDSGFVELPVSALHAVAVAKLPMHHNDPFDRLLLAQAMTEPMKFLTADALLARYSDVVIVA